MEWSGLYLQCCEIDVIILDQKLSKFRRKHKHMPNISSIILLRPPRDVECGPRKLLIKIHMTRKKNSLTKSIDSFHDKLSNSL